MSGDEVDKHINIEEERKEISETEVENDKMLKTTEEESNANVLNEDDDHDDNISTQRWNSQVCREILEYLQQGTYPSDMPTTENNRRRNFRKRTKCFIVENGQLMFRNI